MKSKRFCARLSVLLAVAFISATTLAAERGVAELATRLAKLERALDNRGLLQLLQQVDELKQEVRELRGLVEDQAYALDVLRNTQQQSYADVDRRLRLFEQQGLGGRRESLVVGPQGTPGRTNELPVLKAAPGDAIGGATRDPGPALVIDPQGSSGSVEDALDTSRDVPDLLANRGPAPSRETRTGPRDDVAQPPELATFDDEASENAYKEAFGLLKTGNYEDAIIAFTDFRQRFPRSQYGDNAQWWIAEARYVAGQFEAAVKDYQSLIRNYPSSPRVPQAMLKVGYSYHELGLVEEARVALEDLRRRYPESSSSRLAAERIAQLHDDQM